MKKEPTVGSFGSSLFLSAAAGRTFAEGDFVSVNEAMDGLVTGKYAWNFLSNFYSSPISSLSQAITR